MIWIAWVVVIIATLVVAFLVIRMLWRRLSSLWTELEGFANVLSRFDEIEPPKPDEWKHPLLTTTADEANLRAGLVARRENRVIRRDARYEAAHRRWKAWT